MTEREKELGAIGVAIVVSIGAPAIAWSLTQSVGITVIALLVAMCLSGGGLGVVHQHFRLDDGQDDQIENGPTEDELRALGLSGEYYHHRNTDNMEEFWRRFGPSIRARLPSLRSRTL